MRQAAAADEGERANVLESLERVSRELDASYRDLEGRVARLNQELSLARSARIAELAEKEKLLERMATLMAVLPGGVLLVDGAGLVRDANPAAEELLGGPLLGEAWAAVEARVAALTADPAGRQLSVVSRVLDSQSADRGAEGQGERVVLITDTTELHRLQARVGREERLAALGEMAARFAHQVRTPLASATLYLSMLRRPDLPAERREQICDRLADRLRHTETLIDSTLTFLRGERPAYAAVNVQDLLADARRLVQAQVEAAGAALAVTPVDRSLVVEGAREELAGALANLVSNAVENGGEGVEIALWAGATDARTLQLRVYDTGPGIPEAHLDKVFDPFFTTRAQGTGLGLAVVARTVADHGGAVVAANRPGGGAEFTLELPLRALSGEMVREVTGQATPQEGGA
ncbi:ATP-binding protein [Pseudohaliea sp.]|uniref:sensor histidine kinase n=1 Tax=Pseudohaliea sp. TaxID=2740289 RepID=UPI0032EB36CC